MKQRDDVQRCLSSNAATSQVREQPSGCKGNGKCGGCCQEKGGKDDLREVEHGLKKLFEFEAEKEIDDETPLATKERSTVTQTSSTECCGAKKRSEEKGRAGCCHCRGAMA